MIPKIIYGYEVIRLLGSGNYAKVYLVKNSSDAKFALKIVNKLSIKSKNAEEFIKNERNILTNISHPNIVKLEKSFQDNENLYFLLEFCEGGELYSILQDCGKFTENSVQFYAANIILALEYLHNNNITYREYFSL